MEGLRREDLQQIVFENELLELLKVTRSRSNGMQSICLNAASILEP